MMQFFKRLDEMDAALSSAGEGGSTVRVAELLREPVSASYLVDECHRLDKEDRSKLLRDVALLISHEGVMERPVVVDILRRGSVAASLAEDSPSARVTPASLGQVQSLVAGLVAQIDGDRSSNLHIELVRLCAALRRLDSPDAVSPELVGRVAQSAAKDLGFYAAEAVLLSAGVAEGGEGRRDRESWWRGELIGAVARPLAEQDPVASYAFFRSIVDNALERGDSLNLAANIWRPNIAESTGDGDWRNHLIDALLGAAELTLDRGLLPLDRVLGELWGSGESLYRRLALAIDRRADAPSVLLPALVAGLSEAGVNHPWQNEFRLLLESAHDELSPDGRAAVEEWILAGPNLEGAQRPDKVVEAAKEAWVRDWLALVEPILSDSARLELGRLRQRLGPESETRWSRGIRSGIVRQRSPVAADVLVSLSPPEFREAVADGLESEELGWREDFTEVSRAGLRDAIVTAMGPEVAWLTSPDTLLENPAVYELTMEAMAQRVRSSGAEPLPARVVFDHVLAGMQLTGRRPNRALAELARWMVGTDWVESDGAGPIVVLLERFSSELEVLDDGASYSDPANAALNTTAGIACEAACRALVRLRENQDLAVRLAAAIRGFLGSPATHAAVGLWAAQIAHSLPDWDSGLRRDVFPAAPELFWGAWSAYVRYGHLFGEAWTTFSDEYRRAVHEAPSLPEEALSGTRESLTQHLVVLIAWGQLEPGDEVTSTWFDGLSTEERAEAHRFAAEEAATADLAEEIRGRLVAFARWRLTVSMDPAEFKDFLRWAAAPVSDAVRWELLRDASRSSFSSVYADDLFEFFRQSTSSDSNTDVMRRLIEALTRDAPPYRLRYWMHDLKALLAELAERGGESDDLQRLVDSLGRRGLLELRPIWTSLSSVEGNGGSH